MYDQHTTEVPPAVPSPRPAHQATTVERGSFCTARCSCGWSGPARRSRDLARTDAEGHRTSVA
ncbi:hypothetical protein ACIBI8_25715 [Streptomyces sp. NPDC050529]|uniref:hypothetical protein n=1 Tax=unclassified Streptomyces TaxID=2593676 RepID=UPI002DD893CC|nr:MULTISPECIES: hypothetical protein [unclassified Streptomyces]MEE4489232.1 hypothetical protein [Streptomyces sp. BE230]WRZ83231.1 hypothetical protein OG316_24785 [Streptomyces sp. NBC_01022]